MKCTSSKYSTFIFSLTKNMYYLKKDPLFHLFTCNTFDTKFLFYFLL